jgi:hypothetical protein
MNTKMLCLVALSLIGTLLCEESRDANWMTWRLMASLNKSVTAWNKSDSWKDRIVNSEGDWRESTVNSLGMPPQCPATLISLSAFYFKNYPLSRIRNNTYSPYDVSFFTIDRTGDQMTIITKKENIQLVTREEIEALRSALGKKEAKRRELLLKDAQEDTVSFPLEKYDDYTSCGHKVVTNCATGKMRRIYTDHCITKMPFDVFKNNIIR